MLVILYNKYIFNCILLYLCGTVLKLSAPPNKEKASQFLACFFVKK